MVGSGGLIKDKNVEAVGVDGFWMDEARRLGVVAFRVRIEHVDYLG